MIATTKPRAARSRHVARWYCARSYPQMEHVAAYELAKQGFVHFVPKRITGVGRAERLQVLFPGFIFVKLNLGVDDWVQVSETSGVVCMLAAPLRQPAPVPHGLVEAVATYGRVGDGAVAGQIGRPNLAVAAILAWLEHAQARPDLANLVLPPSDPRVSRAA